MNFHGFLWHRGSLQDLGTLGGDNSEAFWINDAGEVVGRADVSGSESHHAFIWRNGVMTDLGTLGDFPCSTAVAINSAEQTVGDTGVCHVGGGPPFLSEHGQHMVDLSKLVLPGSDITLTDAVTINDRGEIGGMGVLPNGDTHAYVLIPCDDDHADVEGCDYSMVDASFAQNSNTAPRPAAMTQPSTLSPAQTVNQLRNRWMQRYRLPGQRPVP